MEFLNKYIVNKDVSTQKDIEELYWYYNDGREPPVHVASDELVNKLPL